MSRVRVAVMPGPGRPVELREVSEPDLEPGSALLRVELSDVCGTDVALREGRLAGVPYPIIPGHVSAGRLEKIRGAILDLEGRPFREGDPVTDLNRRHLDVRGCWGSDFSHFHRAVALIADPERSRPWGRLATQRYGLTRANQVLDDVATKKVVKALIDPRAEP